MTGAAGSPGNITITNTGTTAIIGWTLSFNFAVSISSIWNATLVSQAGSLYVIQTTRAMTRSFSRGRA